MTRIELMPNSEKIQQLVKNNNGYCPCKTEKTFDTKCMCQEFREQEEGICHCGLYKKVKI